MPPELERFFTRAYRKERTDDGDDQEEEEEGGERKLGREKPKKGLMRLPKQGEYLVFKAGGMDMWAIAFKDRGNVFLLETMYGNIRSALKRKQKDGTEDGMKVPRALEWYNKKMGGVDQHDFIRCGMFFGTAMQGRTMKWTYRLFQGLLDLGLVNCYRMMQFISKGVKNFTQQDVLREVQNGLMKEAYRLDRDGNDGNRLKPRCGLWIIPGLSDKDTSMLVRLQNFYTIHRLQKTTLPRKTREGVDVHRSHRTACQECHDKSRSASHLCKACAEYMHPECFSDYHAHLLLAAINQ